MPDSLSARRLAAREAVERHDGNKAAAARELGISRSTLRDQLEGFDRPQAPKVTAQAPVVSSGGIAPSSEGKPRIRVQAAHAETGNKRVLVISDLHCPYQHVDALRFLAALHAKYDFDRVIGIGDELDFHAMSFHDSDPDLDSAGRELQKGREVLWELERMFPRMDLVDSNHGSMTYRRAKAGGVPRHLILEYRRSLRRRTTPEALSARGAETAGTGTDRW